MNLTLGALLAGGMGGLTAVIDLRLRTVPSRLPSVMVALAGAALGALSYGGFVVVGMAISLLTFSSSPDPGPALVGVLLGCAGFLSLRLLQSFFSSHFGLPEIPAPRPRGIEEVLSARPHAGAAPTDTGPRALDDMLNARLRLGGSRVRHRRSFDDLLDAEPRGGGLTMWLGGVGLALLPLYYGMRCIVSGQGAVGTHIWSSKVDGLAAIALGAGWIGVALFLHFHFFFGLHPTLKPHSRKAKLVSVIVASVGLTIAFAWPMFDQAYSMR